ncbi:hypothetical protein HCB38_07555 [Listeria sp. FSL L7-0083]|uniref:IS630 transposase-related protein n=1 Tax=Listeria farberi TaxID=2713500 RepID=UPI0016270500|nr:IS630 transposase-related protein [Listeria farberi]MBC2267665.1 hypothetical protein [Listeria farberi]
MDNAKYNRLTIIERTDKKTKSGNLLYLCQCECGNTCTTTLAKLRSGHTKSCGCLINDVAAKKFEKYIGMKNNKLTIRADSGKRTKAGQRIVLCQCDCGNTCEVIFAKFNNGYTKSCGCLSLEKKMQKHSSVRSAKVVATMKENNILVENTNIAVISRNTIMSTNKSGVTGVSYDNERNRWIAQITFRGEHKHLGRFIKKEDAIKARKEAEEKYFKPLIDKYSKPESEKPKIDRKKLQAYIKKFPDAPAKDIASHFNVSITAILYHINRYNLKYNKKSRTKTIDQVEFEQFVERNPKLSKKDLAKHFNVTMQTVNIHMRVMNKDFNINIDIEELKEYIKNNPAVNMDELSKHFNVNRRQLFDVMKTHNIKYERKTPRGRKIDVEKLRDYIIENPKLSQKKLAEHFKVSLPTIDRYIKEYDLPYIPKYSPRKNKFV